MTKRERWRETARRRERKRRVRVIIGEVTGQWMSRRDCKTTTKCYRVARTNQRVGRRGILSERVVRRTALTKESGQGLTVLVGTGTGIETEGEGSSIVTRRARGGIVVSRIEKTGGMEEGGAGGGGEGSGRIEKEEETKDDHLQEEEVQEICVPFLHFN